MDFEAINGFHWTKYPGVTECTESAGRQRKPTIEATVSAAPRARSLSAARGVKLDDHESLDSRR